MCGRKSVAMLALVVWFVVLGTRVNVGQVFMYNRQVSVAVAQGHETFITTAEHLLRTTRQM